jgi:formate-dependent nitrite reductase membrane component NrfD
MARYTPQREWIEKRGVWLWFAFFFIELGAGTFIVSTIFGSLSGMLVGWLICALLGGGFHLLFLGKPLRFWRIVFSSGWKTSWISRGLIFVILFLALGLAHMGSTLWSNSPASLLIVTNIFAFLAVIYGGFAMNYVNGIPLWNTALLPVLYVISGLWGGAELTLGIFLTQGEIVAGISVEAAVRPLLIGFVLLIPVYLISVRYTSPAGKVSVRHMVLSKWLPLFWIAVVVLGMAVPAAAVINSFINGLETSPVVFLYAAIFFGLLGDLSLRYLILRCGLYSPLVPTSG